MTESASSRDLFEAVLAIDPAQRAQWLISHCADPDQRGIVERMLLADAAADSVIDLPFDDLFEGVGEAGEDAPLTGTRIGTYLLHDKLGEGGSSIVFRASREQAGVSQNVALKLLRRNLYTQDEQRRFRDERRALAQLQHPGIARLIEGGVTETGTPYIALELVEGETIVEHARSRQLDLQQRLRLFIDVCRAVEAAHRALIVHRDLKPSNVLVTADGDVKLLDFGIAKMLDADAEDHTQTQHMPMTPAYAAPEQFSRAPITTATDVYALGIVLGELITGQRHEQGDSRTPSAQVTENSANEARVASVRAMRRKLRGDLDNIVVKATFAEPEHRYASAGAFADDIERHLDGQPVIAHPPSRMYRTRKFVARHRGGVATTLAFLIAIIAALGMAVWQAELAHSEARRANAMRDFVVGLLRKTAPDVPASERPDVPTLVYTAATSLPSELRDQPELHTELLFMLGDILRDMRDLQHSEALLRQAVSTAEQLPETSPMRVGAQIGLTRTLLRKGDYNEAATRIAPLLALPAQSLPEDVPRETILKVAMVIAAGRADMSQAVSYGHEMLALFRADCASSQQCDGLASAMHDLASVLLDADQIAEARALADETLQRRLRDGATPMSLANARLLKAKIATYRGDFVTAEAETLKADVLIDSLGNSLKRKPLGPKVWHIDALLARGSAAEALGLVNTLLAEQVARKDSRCDIAWNEIKRARAELLLKQANDAAATAAHALEGGSDCKRDVVRVTTVEVARLVHARALVETGDTAAAEADYAHALSEASHMQAYDPLYWPFFLVETMRLANSLGHPDTASDQARQLIAALDRADALPTHPWRIEAVQQLR